MLMFHPLASLPGHSEVIRVSTTGLRRQAGSDRNGVASRGGRDVVDAMPRLQMRLECLEATECHEPSRLVDLCVDQNPVAQPLQEMKYEALGPIEKAETQEIAQEEK